MAVAANARLSLYDGGQYLLARLQPGTPHRIWPTPFASSPTT